ncbi:hypothetical protein EJD88_05385 [Pseudomonas sp. PB105]|nr:hypothetical protein EJD88_05385 [Pseudomonas sp. PB105]MVW97182.1 hypothetical protein [Pseudomonas sp. PB100]
MKRAYELSVCLSDRSYMHPDYRIGGCAWRIGVSIDLAASVQPEASVQCVLFSFHIVEIS